MMIVCGFPPGEISMRNRVVIDQKAQREHFDTLRNQYAADRLSSTELHTELELESLATAIASGPRDKRIVDFGAGTGRCCLYLVRKGYSVEAVDLSKVSLAALKRNAERLGLPQIQTRAELPREPYADAIVGTDVLHHVQLDDTLNHFCTALVEGGRISFSEPGAGNVFWYLYLGKRGKTPPCYESGSWVALRFSAREKILNVSQRIHLRFFPVLKIKYQPNLHFLATGRFCLASLKSKPLTDVIKEAPLSLIEVSIALGNFHERILKSLSLMGEESLSEGRE
jgi:2-polyprenyl-3-methyl-5-hydroxy-6-metoxy-1,4-benzoquinol methylase